MQLVKLLPPTPASLLNWAVELMADVVEEEELNKMNARNIAMVFAPNMTQVPTSFQAELPPSIGLRAFVILTAFLPTRCRIL